jgi:hypothetical protein
VETGMHRAIATQKEHNKSSYQRTSCIGRYRWQVVFSQIN